MALDHRTPEELTREVRVKKRDRNGKANKTAVLTGRSVDSLNKSPANERTQAGLEVASVAGAAAFHCVGMSSTAHIFGVDSIPAAVAIGSLTAATLAILDLKGISARTADRVSAIAYKRAPDLADVLAVSRSVPAKFARPMTALLTSSLLATGLAMHHFDPDISAHLAAKQDKVDVEIAKLVRPTVEAEKAFLVERVLETAAIVQREATLDSRLTHDTDVKAAQEEVVRLRAEIKESRLALNEHESTSSEQARIAECERFGTSGGGCAGTSGFKGCEDRCRAAEILRDQAAAKASTTSSRIAELERSLKRAEENIERLRSNRPGKPSGLADAEAAHQTALTAKQEFDVEARIEELVKADQRRTIYVREALAHRLDALYELATTSPGFLVLFILIWLVAAMLESLAWVAGFFRRTPQHDDRAASDLIATLRAHSRELDLDYIDDRALRAERRLVERTETPQRVKIEDELENYKFRQMANAEKDAFRIPNETWLSRLTERLKALFIK